MTYIKIVLYARRLESNREAKYMKLFELMDKFPRQSEEYYYAKTKSSSKGQFLNTKRHLYSQLVKSLRLLHEDTDLTLRIRQRLDYATILYKRGLYYESLALLNTIKNWPDSTNNILSLEITELIKRIESRHITRNRGNKNQIESLVSSSANKQKLIEIETIMTNISLEVQGLYIKWGFARSDRDALMYKVYFHNQIPPYQVVKISNLATVLYHQSYVWYHYMRLDFHFCYKHAVQWLSKMDTYTDLKRADSDLYVRGFHYVLTSCFYLDDKMRFETWYDKYKDYRKKHHDKFDETSKLLDFCYFDNADLNHRLINNRLGRIDVVAKDLELKMAKLSDRLDIHRSMIFYFKLGMIYSYKGDEAKAIDYYNRVLDNQEQQLRTDIFCYCRLLHLMSHYRINNFNLVINLLPSVKATFESSNMMNPIVELMISFLRKGSKALNFGINDLIGSTLEKLETLKESPYAKVAFLYYDHISWVESIQRNLSIEKLKKADR